MKFLQMVPYWSVDTQTFAFVSLLLSSSSPNVVIFLSGSRENIVMVLVLWYASQIMTCHQSSVMKGVKMKESHILRGAVEWFAFPNSCKIIISCLICVECLPVVFVFSLGLVSESTTFLLDLVSVSVKQSYFFPRP